MASGLRLDITTIAGLYFSRQAIKLRAWLPGRLERHRLHPHLGDDNLFPCLFDLRCCGRPLRAHSRALCVVAFDRPEQSPRLMIGGAKHQKRAAFRQFNQKRAGPGDTMRVDDDGSNLVERHAPDLPAILLDLQKPAITRQVAAIGGDIDNLIQNANQTQLSD